jgi:hypothetical protein
LRDQAPPGENLLLAHATWTVLPRLRRPLLRSSPGPLLGVTIPLRDLTEEQRVTVLVKLLASLTQPAPPAPTTQSSIRLAGLQFLWANNAAAFLLLLGLGTARDARKRALVHVRSLLGGQQGMRQEHEALWQRAPLPVEAVGYSQLHGLLTIQQDAEALFRMEPSATASMPPSCKENTVVLVLPSLLLRRQPLLLRDVLTQATQHHFVLVGLRLLEGEDASPQEDPCFGLVLALLGTANACAQMAAILGPDDPNLARRTDPRP